MNPQPAPVHLPAEMPGARAAQRATRLAADVVDRMAGQSDKTVATAIAASSHLWHAVAAALIEDAPGEQVLDAVRRGAAEWALADIPLDVLHHVVFECGRAAIDMLASNAPAAVGPERGADLRRRCLRIVEVLDVLSHTVAESYLAESARTDSDAKGTARDLTEALLSGDGFRAVARHRGVTLAPRYALLAVAANHRPVEQNLRQLGDEIAMRCGPSGTLARFDLSPGVVLVPDSAPERVLGDIVAQLTSAAGPSVSAVLIYATPSEVSAAAENSAKLLDILQRAKTRPGLHRFADYALEFQLIRAGAGQDALADVLTPLLDHPDLVTTLKTYLQHNGYRRRAARNLHVHENTLTNRLHRISELTGIDPASPTGMWYLRSALVARRAKGHRDPSFQLESRSRARAVRII